MLKPEEQKTSWSQLPFIGELPQDLRQSGLTIGMRTFVLICVGLMAALVGVGLQFYAATQVIPVSVILGVLVPVAVVRTMRDKRTKELTKQLPDALDLLSCGLRVGHPLNTSIGAVADEMPDPIGTEFGIIFDQVSFGDELPDAFVEFSERYDLEDVHYLSASIGIQHGTGGDLARVIQVLSEVIRNRITMRRKIQAITSEGRLTAWFLSSLPVIIYVMTSASSPTYYRGVMEDPLFIPMAVTIVVLTVLNALILRKLVNFRI